ncbi:MAG: hypothetical protein R3F56_23775 [Planctomycetota bacterium]
MKTMLGPVCLSLIVPLAGQASFVTYGQGCNNRGIPPVLPLTIHAQGVPALGKSIEISVHGGPTFSVPYHFNKLFFTGVSRSSYLGWPLPLQIPPWMMNYTGNCDLLCSREIVEPVNPATVQIHIPQEPRLIGAKLYHQWYIWYFVTGSFPDSFSIVSNGGEMTIGL